MARYHDQIPDKFLKADVVPPEGYTLTVAAVSIEVLGDAKKKKAVLSFDEREERLPLNQTNAAAMIEAFGDEMDGWVGQRVHIGVEPVLFAGKRVKGMRLRPLADPTAEAELPF